jgi:hypothetical protein
LGNVTDFKFTDVDRKQATVRFTALNPEALLEALKLEGNKESDMKFTVKLKEEETKGT